MAVKYKIASTEEEFKQIHCLNYKTFVQEIPQHHENSEAKLVDRFHNQNTYLIACDEEKLVAMVAVRDQRPFSLDEKLESLSSYLPSHSSLCEIRLLAVEKEYRHSRIFFGLAQQLANYCLQQKYDLAIMSGTVLQLKLYRQMGFVPFAKLVGSETALYQPMYLTKETYSTSLAGRLHPRMITFLPGPVPIRKEVEASMQSIAISHRSEDFAQTMSRVQQLLCNMTNASYVEVLVGTGTLANDCIAAQLKLRKKKGLIITNGEFGERLIDHAQRAGLEFSVIRQIWGEPFNKEILTESIKKEKADWLWAVYGETSTGMLNDINMLEEVCQGNKTNLCLDAISVLGALPIDLSRVYLASAVSGKGIGGYTGLSFVFHQEKIVPSDEIPRYLDLGLYQASQSVPFSHSSNLMKALLKALELDSPERYESTKSLLKMLRKEIEDIGLRIIVPEPLGLPYIITIQIPDRTSSIVLGDSMTSFGFKLHYESSYLAERNWVQVSVIERDAKDIRKMLAKLKRLLSYGI